MEFDQIKQHVHGESEGEKRVAFYTPIIFYKAFYRRSKIICCVLKSIYYICIKQ